MGGASSCAEVLKSVICTTTSSLGGTWCSSLTRACLAASSFCPLMLPDWSIDHAEEDRHALARRAFGADAVERRAPGSAPATPAPPPGAGLHET